MESVLRGSIGWRLRLAGGGLGAGATLALPPYDILPLMLVGLGGLFVLLDGRSVRDGFRLGMSFGFGFFAAGLYWVGHSFMVERAIYGWLAVPAVVGLALFLALFVGAASALAALAGARSVRGAFVFALAWTVAEWLRGHLGPGFPWNLVGYAWTAYPIPRQAAAFVGLYGLTFLTAFAAALLALAVAPRAESGARASAATAVGLIAALVAGMGLHRVGSNPEGMVDGVRLRLVQGNVPQAEKWLPQNRQRILGTYIALSTAGAGPARPTHLVWPETAVPGPLAPGAALVSTVAAIVPPNGALITGVPRVSRSEDGRRHWNSVQAVAATGAIVATYDKTRRVPFGEYNPLAAVLPFRGIAEGDQGFSAGSGLKTVRLPGLPAFSPVICYEVVYPGSVVRPGDRPAWILNVTNDAWFGMSIGPYQHLAAARMRAVEEGLPLVRAANTGITAVVDTRGAVLAKLDLGQRGHVDTGLPVADEPTVYGRFGDVALWGMLALVALGVWLPQALRRANGWRKRHGS